MPVNPTRTTKEVYGDNLFADLMDFFLIDEPEDLLKLLPGRAVGGGASGLLGLAERAAPRSPAAAMARQVLGKGAEKIDDFGGLLRQLGSKLSGGGAAPATPHPLSQPLSRGNPSDVADMMRRRLTEENKDSLLRTGVTSAVLGEGTRDAAQGMFGKLSAMIEDEINAERQRTGGQGLAGLF